MKIPTHTQVRWINSLKILKGCQTKYIYDANGIKLRRIHLTAVDNIVVPINTTVKLSENQILTSDTTDYLGDLIFENGKLDKILFSSGYVSCDDNNSNKFTFHYYVKDHLGNNRAVVSESGAIEQSTHYYPFGNSFADASTNPSLQPYKYNGKELDRMHGLDWYDYGARNYDPVILQWNGVDQLCEDYYPVSPYVYCLNNPIKFIDIKGLEPGDLFSNPDAAARNFGLIYNYWSIKNNVELSSFIYSLTDKNGKLYYTYNTPNWGNSSSSTPNTKIPKGAQIYGLIHTHAAYDENTEDAHHGNQFSGKDIDTYRPHEFKGSYVCTPNGTLVKFHKKDDGNYETINFKDSKYKLPSDSSDPTNNGYTTNLIDSEWEQKPWYIFFIQTFNEYLEER